MAYIGKYIDITNYRELLNNKYKETALRIENGETFLDNLAEGFTEADQVIRDMIVSKPANEKVTAHWINHKESHQCSNCREIIYREWDGETWGEQGIYKYCPYCSAEMSDSDY